MAPHGTLLVLGSGPGIGVHVAQLFAERGFRQVILASRDAERLNKEVQDVQNAGGAGVTVVAETIDLASESSVATAVQHFQSRLDDLPQAKLECVLYNAARVGPSPLFEFSTQDMERDFRISVTSLYTLAGWACPKLADTAANDSQARPSFLVTSGGLAKTPYPHMFSLALCKAAQYNFVDSLFKAFEPKGVHCGLLVVQGFVKPEAQVTTPRHIAEKAWGMFEQEKGKFDLEVDIVDPEYAAARKKQLEAQRGK